MKAKQKNDPRRRALLAKVHIAKKELLQDDDVLYRAILEREFGKHSAADLSELELGWLVDYFVQHGWQAKGEGRGARGNKQIVTLHARAKEIAGEIDNGERRLLGLVRKCCGVDRLEWCRNAEKLRHLLAALEGISKQ